LEFYEQTITFSGFTLSEGLLKKRVHFNLHATMCHTHTHTHTVAVSRRWWRGL